MAATVPMIAALLAACGGSSVDGFSSGLSKTSTPPGALRTASIGGHGSGVHANATASDASRAVARFTSAADPGNTAYKIGPQDVISVSVFKVPDLTRTVQVADTGTVNLPLVGEIPAAGKTAQELERDLTARLGAEYLQNPQVTIFVKEYNSQRVTIEGSVKKPGVYPIRGNTSLLQFIAIAGGFEKTSDTSNVVVFRTTQGKKTAARFNLDAIRGGQASDPIIREGDVIVVHASQLKTAWDNIIKALPVASMFLLL